MVATETETEDHVPAESNLTHGVFGEVMPGEYFEEIVIKRTEEKKLSENHGDRNKELDLQTWQFSDENMDSVEVCRGWSEPEYDVTDYSIESSESWWGNSYFLISDTRDSDIVGPKLSPTKDFLETIKQFPELKKKAKHSAKKKTSPKMKWRVLSLEETGFNSSLFPRQPVSDASDTTWDSCDFPAGFHDDFVISVDIGDKEESKAEAASPENCWTSNENAPVSSWEDSGWTSSPDSSLFPRQPVTELTDKMEEEYFHSKYSMDFEEKFSKFEHLDNFAGFGAKRRLRHTKNHRKQKAHKQVKTKHCRSVKNNNRKRLYVKHIVYKRMNLEAKKLHFIPSRKRANTEQNIDCKPGAPVAPGPAPASLDPRTQRYTLTPGNIPISLQNSAEMRLIRLLIDLQHREVTPNDYELLLTLDMCVKPKTVDSKTLSRFRTEKVCDKREDNCPICMESFSTGDVMKILPCGHGYHEKCIDTWLSNSSMNCPVDGLPVSKR